MSGTTLRAHADAGTATDLAGYFAALERDRERMTLQVTQKPLADLRDWQATPGSDRITHGLGAFFTIDRIHASIPARAHSDWDQPIVVQSEVGVLGMLAKRIGGQLHFLMQHKIEPGNRNGVQLSPTVQATRSNFTRRHGGCATPYIDRFRDAGRTPHQRVLVDVRQSEQGSWFYRKRNRNIVIEVFDDVDVLPGWHWMPYALLARLLAFDDLVNMEVRSVLACLPLPVLLDDTTDDPRDEPHERPSAAVDTVDLLSWVTQYRSEVVTEVRRGSLRDLRDWTFGTTQIEHRDGLFFTVMAVEVTATSREVRSWDQPMVNGGTDGVLGLLVTHIDDVPHVLLHLRPEPGNVDGAELAPTVQCDPSNYPADVVPAHFADVMDAAPENVLFDTMLSDEGGRFFHTSHRHRIVVTDVVDHGADHRWFSLAQCSELARHSHYLNVQTRSLLACLASLLAAGTPLPRRPVQRLTSEGAE